MRTGTEETTIRMTVDLPLGTIAILGERAQNQGVSLTEAMKRAVARTGLLHAEVERGSHIWHQDPQGIIRELHVEGWPHTTERNPRTLVIGDDVYDINR